MGQLFFAQVFRFGNADDHVDVFVAALGFRAKAAPAHAELASAGGSCGYVHLHVAIERGDTLLRAEHSLPGSEHDITGNVEAFHAELGMSGIMDSEVKIARRVAGIAFSAQAELSAVAYAGGNVYLQAGGRSSGRERDLLGAAPASFLEGEEVLEQKQNNWL